MSIVSISGPSLTGKSRLISLLKSILPTDKCVYGEDLFKEVFNEYVVRHEFGTYEDILKDRDFLFMACNKLIEAYEERLEEYKNTDKLVILDGCYIDYWIFMELNLKYNYPLIEYHTKLVQSMLESRKLITHVFMTTPNDELYKPNPGDGKSVSKQMFKRLRPMEVLYYDLFRDYPNITSLDPTVASCDYLIKQKLIELGLLEG